MVTYLNSIDGVLYHYFYDWKIQNWTVYRVDNNGYQVGNAEYFANRTHMLGSYAFDFKYRLKEK